MLDGKAMRLGRYHDVREKGEHQIVVQALRHHLFGMTTEIVVDGFVAGPDGMRDLTEPEKWPFL